VTAVRVGVVDVCVLRKSGRAWKVLALRRVSGRSPGSWELVHGHIDDGELPVQAARRELREESGFTTDKLYTITSNAFYLLKNDTVMVSLVFAAIVDSDRVTLGPEHDRYEWLSVAAAQKKLTWPRDGQSVLHAWKLLKSGDAGVVEDVLRAEN
jgi:8-oxo-dGTP pyrophosphatase MutT (NUDIX family)